MIIDKALLDKVVEKTTTDYEPYNTKREGKVLIDTEGVICIIEDLLYEIDRLEERYEDMREFFHEHYVYRPEPEPECFD